MSIITKLLGLSKFYKTHYPILMIQTKNCLVFVKKTKRKQIKGVQSLLSLKIGLKKWKIK